MKQIQLKSIPDYYSDFAIYIMFSENTDIIYMAIFQKQNHYKERIAFMDYVEIQQFNSNKKNKINILRRRQQKNVGICDFNFKRNWNTNKTTQILRNNI